MARLLISKGYAKVRPLEGGLEAWVEAGYEVERPLVPLTVPATGVH